MLGPCDRKAKLPAGVTVSRTTLVLLVVSLAAFTPAAANDLIFVQIPGIPGQSTEPDHPGWIEAFALINDTTFLPGGGAGGEAAARSS